MAAPKKFRPIPAPRVRPDYEVRVRGLGIPLTGSINAEEMKSIVFSIPDNLWTAVDKQVYDMLRLKHENERVVMVQDARANEEHPHLPGEEPIRRAMTAESAPYYLDFRSTKE